MTRSSFTDEQILTNRDSDRSGSVSDKLFGKDWPRDGDCTR